MDKKYILTDKQIEKLGTEKIMTEAIDVCTPEEETLREAKRFGCQVVSIEEGGNYGGDFRVEYFGTKENLDRLIEHIGMDEKSFGLTWVVVSRFGVFGLQGSVCSYELMNVEAVVQHRLTADDYNNSIQVQLGNK